MISVITVSHGHSRDAIRLATSLSRHMTVPFEVILIDNLNEHTNWDQLLLNAGINDFRVIRNNRPRSFSYNNNSGAGVAKFAWLAFLNPDIQLIDTSLPAWLEREPLSAGLFFPRLLNPDGSPQAHAKAKPKILNQIANLVLRFAGINRDSPQGTYWYFGAALLVTHQFFTRIGRFDTNFPLFAEDTELCDRARKMGYAVESIDTVSLIHTLGGQSKGRYLGKAIVSNVYLRLKMLKNTIDSRLS